MDFTSIEELVSYIEKEVPVSLEVIGKQIREILYGKIDELWYSTHEPNYYSRTREYIDSLTCSKAVKTGTNEYKVTIYFATHKIIPRIAPIDGDWNQHAGVNYEDVSDRIPEFIEEGNKSSLYSYEGVHPVGKTKELLEAEDYLRVNMVRLLSKYGFNCTLK